MADKVDFKKTQKELYLPGPKPVLVQVPEMGFFMVDGAGAPEGAAYQNAVSVLYALTFTVKMSKMSGRAPGCGAGGGEADANPRPANCEHSEQRSRQSGHSPRGVGEGTIPGYFEYVVPPLEGLWDSGAIGFQPDRAAWTWTALIRQPDFVDEAVFEWAKAQAARKKPELDFETARFECWEEGLCAQLMHTGPYAAEQPSVDALSAFIHASGYTEDMAGRRRHHEIYLGDPRRVAPEKLKTVLRHPIKKA